MMVRSPPERMKMLDDEVNKHSLRFIRDSVAEKKPFFVSGIVRLERMFGHTSRPGMKQCWDRTARACNRWS